MKRNEVPQDEAFFGEYNEITYAVDKDGRYSKEKSKGWDPKIVANSQYWKALEEDVQATVKEVRDGKASPILYYMTVMQMDIGLLASYVGLWRWTVKRHLKPSVFTRLKPDMLEKYAAIFEITVDQLKTLPEDAEHPECISKWATIRE